MEKDLLISAFRAALAAVDPLKIVPAHLPPPPKGRTLVVGGGKAAAAMAKAAEDNWPADAPLSGMVATRYLHGLPCRRIEVVEASHPLPDGRGASAAQRMLDLVRQLNQEDLLLVLLSGGGSSLLALPVEGIALDELRLVTKALLASGASIQEINTVRKHLTRFSGGQVAGLSGAPLISLILSDVVGNDPTYIASGPCIGDPTTFADALSILKRFAINGPASVVSHLQRGQKNEIPDTPKPGSPIFRHASNRVIGSAQQALKAAEAFLTTKGLDVVNLGEIEGESRTVARHHAELILDMARQHRRPFALLSGGETSVTVKNKAGRGGRNTEYLLALGLALAEMENVWALACDSDGIDGTEDNAGAIWSTESLVRGALRELKPQKMLQENNAYEFFKALDDLLITGPTRTNVNDFRLVIVA